jgi:uncharacterized membrane protein HdeD (DUF308 family)
MSAMRTPDLLQTTWWVVVLRGVAALLFGVLALMWPGLTLLVLVALFGAYALVDGLMNIGGALERRRRYDRWWVLLIEGIAGVLAGILTFMWPAITAAVLVLLIAARAIVVGVFEVVAAIRLRREIAGEWLLAAAGILSVVFGLLLFLFPGAGALAISWLIGWYALIAGALLTVLGFRLRGAGLFGGAARVR